MRSFRSNKEVGDFLIFVIFINIIVCWIFSHFSNRCLARVLSREFPEQWTRKDSSLQLEFGTAAAFQPESTVDECRCYRVRFPLFKSTATRQRKSIVWQRQLCSSGHLEKRNHNATISFACFYSGEKFDKFLNRCRNCNWSPFSPPIVV